MRAASTARSTSRPTRIRELGVGINTLPHAIKELKELGLLERLDAVAIRTYELFYLNRFGQEIWREPRGLDAGYDVPQFSIHRGKLQGVIYQAARARLGESRFHLRPPARQLHAGRCRRHRVFLRPRRLASRDRARRRADRRRRHPFVRARNAVSERRPGALERHHAVARRGRLAAVPDRPLDDRSRAAWRRSSCSIRSAPARAPTAGSPTGP